jgi:hypothetical protein
MPVEAQSRAPLGRRDRRLLALLAVATLAGAAALGVALATRGSPSNAGCVVVAVPSTLGGATLRSCGRAAHEFCRTQGKKDPAIAAACRRQGFPP